MKRKYTYEYRAKHNPLYAHVFRDTNLFRLRKFLESYFGRLGIKIKKSHFTKKILTYDEPNVRRFL